MLCDVRLRYTCRVLCTCNTHCLTHLRIRKANVCSLAVYTGNAVEVFCVAQNEFRRIIDHGVFSGVHTCRAGPLSTPLIAVYYWTKASRNLYRVTFLMLETYPMFIMELKGELFIDLSEICPCMSRPSMLPKLCTVPTSVCFQSSHASPN